MFDFLLRRLAKYLCPGINSIVHAEIVVQGTGGMKEKWYSTPINC
jgi:hypothetical protein